MPIDLHYDQEKKALYGTLRNPLTIDDIKSEVVTIKESADYPIDVRTLWDLRQLDFNEIDRSFEEMLIDFRRGFRERRETRLAFVVANDLGYGMMRMYQILSDDLPQQIGVFREYSEAEDWLLSELR